MFVFVFKEDDNVLAPRTVPLRNYLRISVFLLNSPERCAKR